MKLIRFSQGDSKPRFGVVIGDHAVAFATLQQRSGITRPDLSDSRAYLAGLPESERAARELAGLGRGASGRTGPRAKSRSSAGRAAARADRGGGAVRLRADAAASQELRGNHDEVREGQSADRADAAGLRQGAADQAAAPPARRARALVLLQVQHELDRRRRRDHSLAALHVAPGHRARAGRRLRQPAAAGGGLLHLQRRLGPRRPGAGVHRRLLPDEGHGQGQSARPVPGHARTRSAIRTPSRSSSRSNGQVRYQGSTSEIDHKAEDVFAWLGFITSIKPGTVMGFGTIPDCTGLDHDDFIDPGAEIEISFERLGTLALPLRRTGGQAAAQPLAAAAGAAEVPRPVGTASADAWQDNSQAPQEET